MFPPQDVELLVRLVFLILIDVLKSVYLRSFSQKAIGSLAIKCFVINEGGEFDVVLVLAILRYEAIEEKREKCLAIKCFVINKGGEFDVVLVLAILRYEAIEEKREKEKRKNEGLEGKDGMTLKPRKT